MPLNRQVEWYKRWQNMFIETKMISIGNELRVFRSASDGEMGWTPMWMPDMDRYIGCGGEVTMINASDGFYLEDHWCFPFFVFEEYLEFLNSVENKNIVEEMLEEIVEIAYPDVYGLFEKALTSSQIQMLRPIIACYGTSLGDMRKLISVVKGLDIWEGG